MLQPLVIIAAALFHLISAQPPAQGETPEEVQKTLQPKGPAAPCATALGNREQVALGS